MVNQRQKPVNGQQLEAARGRQVFSYLAGGLRKRQEKRRKETEEEESAMRRDGP